MGLGRLIAQLLFQGFELPHFSWLKFNAESCLNTLVYFSGFFLTFREDYDTLSFIPNQKGSQFGDDLLQTSLVASQRIIQ